MNIFRNIKYAKEEASRMVELIKKPESEVTLEERQRVAKEVAENFAGYINKGFLEYRKSVTEAGEFAVAEWKGQGSIMTDALGREFIDVLGGFGIYSAGIRHPKIVAAVKAQLDRSPQYSQEMLDPLRAHLGKVLAHLTPGDLQNMFFINSGTEAIEGAMKLAKFYTGKSGFISTTAGFHGKTLGSLSLMGKSVFRKPLMPLIGNVRHVPFGDADALEQQLAIAEQVGDDIAAFVAEPVQGEAGAVVPPDDYWRRVRQICDKYGVLLIADEVQTGLGRTGKLFGLDNWDVVPDIMALGKALGGGVMPISAFITNPKIWKVMEPNPFMHTSTTGGNPLACAAALAYIDVMIEEDLPAQAAEKGEYVMKALGGLQKKYPHILKDYHGMGLLIGMEFPTDETGYQVASGLFKKKVLTAGTLTNAKAIRIEPALNIPYNLLDEVLNRLEDTFKSI
ncbi:putrescine aminotransferase [Geovibrio thiophilus]|uniref:Putrescine aminotransferase n=2 Tax=Geovibrio thiophilus TaxID=139438 RepID=A0A410K279_9BACT|nr:putrescine aminotransferase [Geovibrio thiophilus]